MLRSWVAQGDLVRLGDDFGLDRSQPLAQPLASLPQELERVGGGILGRGAVRISPVLLDEMSLKGRSDFVGRLQRVVDRPVPCGVVNRAASIPPRPVVPGPLPTSSNLRFCCCSCPGRRSPNLAQGVRSAGRYRRLAQPSPGQRGPAAPRPGARIAGPADLHRTRATSQQSSTSPMAATNLLLPPQKAGIRSSR
jgi:hypothetical protein